MVSRISANAFDLVLLLVLLFSKAPAQTDVPPVSEQVYKVGGNVTAPRLLYDPAPEYSDAARKTHHQGISKLRLVVGSDGRPRDITVTQSIGLGLDEKSVEAIRKWRFEPGRRGGAPVAVETTVTVSFSFGRTANTQELLERAQYEAPLRPPVTTAVEPCPPSFAGHERRSSAVNGTVADVRLDGALQLSVADQEEIASSIKHRTYEGTLDEIKSDVLERVKAAWQNRGYFNAEVSGEAKILTSIDAGDRLAFTVYVAEGRQYRLGGITFKNNTVFRDASLLRNLFSLKDGDLFDRDKVRHGLDALYQAYAEAGYINFTSIPDTKFNDENNLVDLDINLDEDKQFSISGIKIVGSDEHLIRDASKDLLFQPGDVYNQRLLDLFLRKHASLMNPDRDRNDGLRLDEQAGTVAITFDLRNCPVLASRQ